MLMQTFTRCVIVIALFGFASVAKDQATGGGTAISDGKLVKVYVPQLKRWSEEEAPAKLDDIIDSQITVIAQQAADVMMLLHSNPLDRLTHGAVKINYAGLD